MSLPPNSELSLLQLVQNLEPSLPPISLSGNEFVGLIQDLMTCYREQAIAAQVWIRFPPISDWLNPVEDYFESGLAVPVYDCGLGKVSSKRVSEAIAPGWNRIILESGGQIQHEYFLILLAPEFCVMLIGQEVGGATSPSLAGAKEFKLNYSLIPQSIEKVLQFLKQRVTITDNTPEELISDSVLAFPLPEQGSARLLTKLLHHHIHTLVNVAPLAPPIPIPVTPTSFEPWLEEPQFLINVTQELSLPLTNIKTALSLLDSLQHKREQRQRYLDLLQRECDRQTSLIAGLQELIHLNHPFDDKEKVARLEDCVPGVVSTYQPIAEEKGISLGYNIPAGLPPVLCPTPWLRQMLQHLLHNSLKFTPAEGKVYVRVSLHGEQIEVAVSDTGIGIDMSDLPKLFHYFYRGRNALGAETAGAGFGLAIVQQLAKRCGGSITVTSHLNRGSTFRLLLPVKVKVLMDN